MAVLSFICTQPALAKYQLAAEGLVVGGGPAVRGQPGPSVAIGAQPRGFFRGLFRMVEQKDADYISSNNSIRTSVRVRSPQ